MADQQKVIRRLSNHAIFSDLEWPNPYFKVRSFLTLNISEMAKDMAIVTMEGQLETVPKLWNGTIIKIL